MCATGDRCLTEQVLDIFDTGAGLLELAERLQIAEIIYQCVNDALTTVKADVDTASATCASWCDLCCTALHACALPQLAHTLDALSTNKSYDFSLVSDVQGTAICTDKRATERDAWCA